MTSSLCSRCRENEPANNDEWCPDCVLEVELILAEMEERDESDDFHALGSNGQYTLQDLEVRVAEYEDEYGLTSDALLEMHQQELAPLDLSSYDRHAWLSFYRELLEERRK